MGIVTETPYPSDLDDFFVLSDDRRIHVRALRRFEEEPIRELFAHLSPRSRHLRFLSPLRALPDVLVRRLASVDYRRHLALVAEYETRDGHEIVGLGSFGAVDEQHVEVALAVRDDWQRRRIGTELAIRVLDAAEARRFHRFVGHVVAGNDAIRKLIRNVGDVVSGTTSLGMSELVFIRRRMS